MLDDILDFLHGAGEGGWRALVFLSIIALLYPLLGIITGFQSELQWLWNLLIAVALFLAFHIARGAQTMGPEAYPWWSFLAYTSPLVMIAGIVKPGLGILAGMLMALIPWLIVAAGVSLGVLAYSAVGAALSDETLEGAERRSGRTFKAVLGFVCWEWVAGLFLYKYGNLLSLELGMTLLFTAILFLLMEWAWEYGAAKGKALAFAYVIAMFVSVIALMLRDYLEAGTPFFDTNLWFQFRPFAIFASIAFVLQILDALKLNKGFWRPVRWGVSFASVIVFLAACSLALPVSTLEEIPGGQRYAEFSQKVLRGDRLKESYAKLHNARRTARDQRVAKVDQDITPANVATKAGVDGLLIRLEAIASDFSEFPDPRGERVGQTLLGIKRNLWQARLTALDVKVKAKAFPTQADSKAWDEELSQIATDYPELKQDPLFQEVWDGLKEKGKQLTKK